MAKTKNWNVVYPVPTCSCCGCDALHCVTTNGMRHGAAALKRNQARIRRWRNKRAKAERMLRGANLVYEKKDL